eukprot:jgi/Mesvir1/6892/Mv09054-RA.1
MFASCLAVPGCHPPPRNRPRSSHVAASCRARSRAVYGSAWVTTRLLAAATILLWVASLVPHPVCCSRVLQPALTRDDDAIDAADIIAIGPQPSHLDDGRPLALSQAILHLNAHHHTTTSHAVTPSPPGQPQQALLTPVSGVTVTTDIRPRPPGRVDDSDERRSIYGPSAAAAGDVERPRRHLRVLWQDSDSDDVSDDQQGSDAGSEPDDLPQSYTQLSGDRAGTDLSRFGMIKLVRGPVGTRTQGRASSVACNANFLAGSQATNKMFTADQLQAIASANVTIPWRPTNEARSNRIDPESAAQGQTWRVPDFFVIGAQKSGTSTLWSVLSLHPHIRWGQVKENFYFRTQAGPVECSNSWGPYLQQFNEPKSVLPLEVVGDFTTTLLVCPCCARVMHMMNPGARVVALLRSPVPRARSRYQEQMSNQNTEDPNAWPEHDKMLKEGKTFAQVAYTRMQAIKKCNRTGVSLQKCMMDDSIVGWGYYTAFLSPWLEEFGPDRVLVIYTEELVRDLLAVVGLVENFLGISNFKYSSSVEDARFNSHECYGWAAESSKKRGCVGKAKKMEAKPTAKDREKLDELARFYSTMVQELQALADCGIVRQPPSSWHAN